MPAAAAASRNSRRNRGASRLHVVACGRLTDYGHSFTYCGLRMRLATLKAPEA